MITSRTNRTQASKPICARGVFATNTEKWKGFHNQQRKADGRYNALTRGLCQWP